MGIGEEDREMGRGRGRKHKGIREGKVRENGGRGGEVWGKRKCEGV